ncbi:MAG TPA: PAS domain S-box protein [Opitutaceae bacterium]
MKTPQSNTAVDSQPPFTSPAGDLFGDHDVQPCSSATPWPPAGRSSSVRREALLDALLQLGSDMVVTVDARGRFTFLNRLPGGQSGAGLVGRRVAAFVGPEHRVRVWQAMALVRATGAPHAFECRTRERVRRWLVVRMSLLQADQLEPEYVAIITDVTWQHQFGDARQKLAVLLDHSTDAIVEVSTDGIVIDWNRGAEMLFGQRSEAAQGRPLLEFVPVEDRAREQVILNRAWAGEPTLAAEGRRLRSDGEIVSVVVATLPHHSEGGRATGATQIVRNLSALRTLETQLEQAQRLVAQGRLAAAAAHEIANCLAVIHGNATVLDELVSEPDASRRIAALLHASTLGGHLCGQLRDLSRPQAASPERIDLVATVRRVFLMLERIVRQRLVLQIDVEDPLLIFADASHVDLIIVNLVLNARDATPIGGTITIRVGAAESAGLSEAWRRVEVIDNGSGIPTEVQGQLFKAFFTTKSPGQGTGLGLATVHRLVRGMAGEVELASESGQGTCVRILLPPPARDEDV